MGRRGVKPTPVDKEIVLQTYAATGTIAETTRRTEWSRPTVKRILLEAQNSESALQDARAKAAATLAARIHIKAEDLLDSITPEDIESGRIPKYDKDGKLAGYQYYGPNLVQKATAFGIITDKANVVQQYEKALSADHSSGQLLMPADIEGLQNAVTGKLQELKMLHIRFADDNKDLVQRTEEVIAESAALGAVADQAPDVIDFDNFDA